MNISSIVRFDKNWELENRKVCFNTIGTWLPAPVLYRRAGVVFICRIMQSFKSSVHFFKRITVWGILNLHIRT